MVMSHRGFDRWCKPKLSTFKNSNQTEIHSSMPARKGELTLCLALREEMPKDLWTTLDPTPRRPEVSSTTFRLQNLWSRRGRVVMTGPTLVGLVACAAYAVTQGLHDSVSSSTRAVPQSMNKVWSLSGRYASFHQ